MEVRVCVFWERQDEAGVKNKVDTFTDFLCIKTKNALTALSAHTPHTPPLWVDVLHGGRLKPVFDICRTEPVNGNAENSTAAAMAGGTRQQ